MQLGRLLGCGVLAILGLASHARAAPTEQSAPQAPPATGNPAAPLAERHTRWLAEVDVILSLVEREAFLALRRDYQRDAFIERFWRERDPDRHTGGNEFRERWQEKLAFVQATFTGLADPRSRVFLFFGEPAERVLVTCKRRDAQAEIWMYAAGSELETHPFPVFFRRPYGATPYFELWEPGDPAPEESCEPDTLSIDEQFAFRQAHKLLLSWDPFEYLVLLARVRERPPAPDREWVATFQGQSTDLPDGAAALAAELRVALGGQRQSRRLVEGTVLVAPWSGGAMLAGRDAERHFLLNGEVLHDDTLFESFRVQYRAAPGSPAPLGFVRTLRPGTYTLVVRVEEPASGAFFRVETPLEVAPLDRAPSVADAPMSEEAALELLAPTGAVRGRMRFDARITGVVPASVEFRLDGKRILVKRAAPWSVELDLGAAARPRRIEAVAFDAAGNELLRDEKRVNAGSYRFAVRLLEPRGAAAPGTRVRARAEVAVPEGAELQRLDFELDGRVLAALFGPPFELPLTVPRDAAVHILRAVAVLADGAAAEDSRLLNAPGASAEVDVRMVEVYARVTSKNGAAVEGLTCADFALREDGVAQTLARCEPADDQTLHLGVLLDTSASMAANLAEAERAADGFLTALVRPRDRATIVAFNDFPNRLAPFTNDLAALRSGLHGLKAERGTALWDALVGALQDFGGVAGRRALLLLSDGEDRSSSATFDEARALARQSGVVVYAVGIDLPLGGPRGLLRRLSEETGGRAFFVHGARELAAIYARIAGELRSQYLLAYQSTGTGEGFRTLTVTARRSGVEIEAPAGYQP